MKFLQLLCIILSQLVATSYALACDTGYFELACRGKIGLSFEATGPQGQGPDGIKVSFNRTNFGVGGNYGRLPSGSCAWLDRGVNTTEPAVVEYSVNPTYP